MEKSNDIPNYRSQDTLPFIKKYKEYSLTNKFRRPLKFSINKPNSNILKSRKFPNLRKNENNIRTLKLNNPSLYEQREKSVENKKMNTHASPLNITRNSSQKTLTTKINNTLSSSNKCITTNNKFSPTKNSLALNQPNIFSQRFIYNSPFQKDKIEISKNNFPKVNSKYLFYILKGNNKTLVEEVMENRLTEWKETDIISYNFDSLIWTPLSSDVTFVRGSFPFINHFEKHSEISNKLKLFENLLDYCNRHNVGSNMFSFVPLTIPIKITENLNDSINMLGFKKIFYNVEKFIEPIKISPIKYHSFFQMTGGLHGYGSYDQIIKIPKSNYAGKNYWIVKPINLNRGRKILVENDYYKIFRFIEDFQKKKKMSEIKASYIIIQKYIENPILYQNKKTDIRIWILFMENYPFNVFVFKEGHFKITLENYSLESKNQYVHLTNYSLQKHHKDFYNRTLDVDISYADFQKELDRNNINVNFRRDIYPKIIKIIKIIASACFSKVNMMKQKNCFEIFGCDFMLDSNFNPYLLEVNTNPGMLESSELHKLLTLRMVDDTFRLTIDNIMTKKPSKSRFPLPGYKDEENLWEKFSF